MKQHHSRVPPVSLQVDAKVFAGGGGYLIWSYSILDAFLYICCSLLDNESTYTPTVRIFMAKMVDVELHSLCYDPPLVLDKLRFLDNC